MVDLPESSSWHPLKAAHEYELLAEEAAGKAAMAFTEYGRLKSEFKAREKKRWPKKSINAIDVTWGTTGEAKKCASDLATYSNLAQMYAAMATMKHTRFVAEQEHRKGKAPVADPE